MVVDPMTVELLKDQNEMSQGRSSFHKICMDRYEADPSHIYSNPLKPLSLSSTVVGSVRTLVL